MPVSTGPNASAQPLIMRILIRPVVYRHPRAWGGVCLAAGLWVLSLGIILCAYSYWWGALLIATGTLETWIAWRLLSLGHQEARSG
jgi:hypothetical protein